MRVLSVFAYSCLPRVHKTTWSDFSLSYELIMYIFQNSPVHHPRRCVIGFYLNRFVDERGLKASIPYENVTFGDIIT